MASSRTSVSRIPQDTQYPARAQTSFECFDVARSGVIDYRDLSVVQVHTETPLRSAIVMICRTEVFAGHVYGVTLSSQSDREEPGLHGFPDSESQ